MQLRRRESAVQHRRHDLESQLPLAPQTAEEVHDNERLADCAEQGRDAGEEEETR